MFSIVVFSVNERYKNMHNNIAPIETFKNLPLEKKLTVTILMTTVTVLALISLAIIAKTWVDGISRMKDDLTTYVLIIKPKAVQSLLTEDKSIVEASMQFLQAFKPIIYAQVLNKNNSTIAEYSSNHHREINSSTSGAEGFSFKKGRLTYGEYIYLGNKKIGAVHITTDYRELRSALMWQFAFTIAAVLVSLLISSALARLARETIFRPLKELYEVAGKVSKNHNYSLRAIKTSDDEIGLLVTKFNEMLSVIEDNHNIIEKQTKDLLIAQSLAKVGNWQWQVATNEVTLSPQALQLLDLPPNIEKPPLDFLINRLEDKDSAMFKEAVGSLVSREQSHTYVEYKIKLINGESRTLVDELDVQYDDDGSINKIIAVTQDITNRKKTYDDLQMAQKLDSIGLLAGGIAHDFNNLLTIIMGHLSLGKISAEEKENQEDYRILDQAEKAAYRAKTLTDKLLTFSSSNLPTKIPFSLKMLLSESANMVFSGSQIIHTINYKKSLLNLNGDQRQLRQVINNLYLNAKESMKKGGLVTTTTDSVMMEHFNNHGLIPGYYIMVKVKDEGCGINKSDVKKIFDPYYTTKPDCSGLGLSTCYSIIKNHGGAIEVTSRLNKGTEFTFYLPAVAEDLLETDGDNTIIEKGTGKILLMEDEESIGEFISILLTKYGYTVDHTLNGEEAIDHYKKSVAKNEPYKAVILDLTIKGGMGGRETIEELLRINPKIKAIVSSGYLNDPIMADYRKFGFKASVAKPYRSYDLLTTISRVIKNKESEVN